MAASLTGDSQHLVTCGNCLEEEGYILNPVLLPCSHCCCETCLRNQLKKSDVVKCRVCDEKFAVSVESLPSALENIPPIFCDTCTKKGKRRMTSKVFCIQCDRKFCALHQETHMDLNEHHSVLAIKEYLESSVAAEQRFCDTHKSQPIALGCADCWRFFCLHCMSSADICVDGKNHKFMSLSELSHEVKSKFEPEQLEAEKVFDEWSAVVKEATILLSTWDNKTEEGETLIDETEEKQHDAIREKYAKLKTEYQGKRISAKEKLENYLEKDAGTKVKELHQKLKEFRSEVSNKHCVDLVKEKTEVMAHIRDAVNINFPVLVIDERQKPQVKETRNDDIDIELATEAKLVIGASLKGNRKPPTKMKFIRSMDVGGICYTVCSYKGYVYVGLSDRSISRVDETGNLTPKFMTFKNVVLTIRPYQDRLYTLIYGQPYQICVHNLNGQLITSWNHPDTKGYNWGNKLAFVNNQLLVPESTNQMITIYNLDGRVLRQIPCPQIPKSQDVSMCMFEEDTVIMTTSNPNSVIKLNIKSETVMWTKTMEERPIYVAAYGSVVLVSGDSYNYSKRSVWIKVLNCQTGEQLAEFTDRVEDRTIYSDLFLEGNRLMIPDFCAKSILCYDLLND